MADGKWISGLHRGTPVADAARHVLTVRLQLVRDYLPKAVQEADDDPENVHQLRVGTRRARAAVDIFALCLPVKNSKAARKQLRRIRRAAGAARDWDVFLASLHEWRSRSDRQRAGLDVSIGYAVGRRAAAQADLEEIAAEGPAAFDRLVAETVAAVHRPHGSSAPHTLAGLARPLLADLLRKLDEAAARDLDEYDNLHKVRIAGKRLRYAMEVFADCFGDRFREELYPPVEEMQEILGAANDSHVACRHLEDLRTRLRRRMPEEWQRFRPGVEGLLRYHRKRLPRERQRFVTWWQRWREAGSEAVLTGLLQMPASA
jgi:CHAD domain-containing protein